MIGFGIAAPGKHRERALKLAMLVLVLVAVFVIALGMASDANSGRSPNAGDLIDAVQMSVSYWVVVIVQWLMLRYLRLREAEREAISLNRRRRGSACLELNGSHNGRYIF